MKRIVILRSGDCAAAGGDDVSARFTQTADRLVLDAAESFLAVFPDNVGGCATTQADDFLVRVGEFLAEGFCQSSAYRGFTAAGHTDEDNIFHIVSHLRGDGIHKRIGPGRAEKQFVGPLGLCHQHSESPDVGDAKLFRLQKQRRAAGIVDYVRHAGQAGEYRQIHGRFSVIRVHSHGSGIDDHVRIGVTGNVFVIVLPGAGDNNGRAAPIRHNGHRRQRSAAGAEDQAFFACHVDLRPIQHISKSVIIRVVAAQASVGQTEESVYRSDLFGRVRNLAEIGDHGFFVGNRYVDSRKIAVGEKGGQIGGRHLKKTVFVIAQGGVDGGGIAVGQVFPQQTVDFLFHINRWTRRRYRDT